MRSFVKGMSIVVVMAVAFLVVHNLAADGDGREKVVIYPGDYVVQSGDVDANGRWRDGVTPTQVTVVPGETVVQKADVSSLGRWRIDVDPVSGSATAIALSERPEGHAFEAAKVEVSPHLNVTLIDCEDCGSPTATSTRTIYVAGTFAPVPPASLAAQWTNAMIGWPSTPSSSGNVQTVSVPGAWDPPGEPYFNGDSFGFRFAVELDPVATFRVYVDVLGDITEP